MDYINELETKNIFEKIKHIDECGNEYWEARELQKVLEYEKWDNFFKVIKQAMMVCQISNIDTTEQFPEVGKMSINVNGGKRRIIDYHLTRYACYLIAQNGDSRKKQLHLPKHILQSKLEKWKLLKKNIPI